MPRGMAMWQNLCEEGRVTRGFNVYFPPIQASSCMYNSDREHSAGSATMVNWWKYKRRVVVFFVSSDLPATSSTSHPSSSDAVVLTMSMILE